MHSGYVCIHVANVTLGSSYESNGIQASLRLLIYVCMCVYVYMFVYVYVCLVYSCEE